MGTVTVTPRKHSGVLPTGTGKIVDIALSSSYATGGDTLTLASLGVTRLQALILASTATSPAGHAVEIIHGATEGTNPLLRVRDAATGAEIANATNLSAQSVRALVVGDLANV